MKNLLTKKQEDVLAVISNYINLNGYSPTISELCKLLNVRSNRTVTQYLDSLQKKKLVYRNKYVRRGIILTKKQFCDSGVEQIPVINTVDFIGKEFLPNHLNNDFISISKKIIESKKNNLIAVRAVGNSMVESEIFNGDIFILENNDQVSNGDCILTMVNGMPVIGKISFSKNSVVLNLNSKNNDPIVMHKNFKILGKIFEIIKKQSENVEKISFASLIPVPKKIHSTKINIRIL